MFRLSPQHITGLKLVIHCSALIPLVWVYYLGIAGELGGDPVEEILHFSGIGALNLLLISLTVSPLAKLTKQAALIRVRRLIGLYAFVYALMHFISFLAFELQFEWQMLVSEIIKRPYITVGFVALLLLTSLAATSTKWAQKKLKRNWQRLHNLVYLAALLIALHYIWSVKSDIVQPLFYWAMLLALLYFRKDKFVGWIKKSKKHLHE